ncbi:MAG: beta-galactosidase [Methylococcaceae bacterium]
MTNPDIECLVLRDVWSNIETQEGVYNWSYVDDQIQRISATGKSISLVINSGGQNIPAWIMDLNVQKLIPC